MRRALAFFLNLQKRRAQRRMARKGLTPDQAAAEAVVTGRAWDEFCDTLKAAGGSVLGFGNPTDPETQAEGFRYLSRLIRAGLENFIESGDASAPTLRRLVHETVKLGADNPDFIYRNAVLDGREEYVISGNMGTTPFMIMSTQDGDYTDQRNTEMPFAGQITTDEMVIDADGNVEITLSNERKGMNWLRTTPETKMVMIRELTADRSRDTSSTLTIRRVGGDGAPTHFGPDRLVSGLAQTSQLVAGASLMFVRWANGMKERSTNELPRFDQAKSDAAGGDPQMAYYHSYWNVPEGKALIIETPVPECTTWNCVLQNHWMESLDYRYSRIHVNKHSAAYRPDGSVRIVIAHDDPGLPNWLDTQGHDFGTICFRWNRAASHPVPSTRLVDIAELDALRAEEAAAPSHGIAYTPVRPVGRGATEAEKETAN